MVEFMCDATLQPLGFLHVANRELLQNQVSPFSLRFPYVFTLYGAQSLHKCFVQCLHSCFYSIAGSCVAFSPGNLSTSSSASSTLGSPENEEYILSFETIDKMRRVSSYSSLTSLIGKPKCFQARLLIIQRAG